MKVLTRCWSILSVLGLSALTAYADPTVAFTNSAGADVASYKLGDDDIFVTVNDAAKNTDPNTPQQITVTVTDQQGGSGDSETLTLTETGNNTGIFRNTADANGHGLKDDNFSTSVAGVLQTENGRTITATY